MTWVRTCASVCDSVLSDLRESLKEYVLRNESLLTWIAVCTIVLDAVRNVELVIHASYILDEELYLLVIV